VRDDQLDLGSRDLVLKEDPFLKKLMMNRTDAVDIEGTILDLLPIRLAR